MKVNVLHMDGCQNAPLAFELVKQVATELGIDTNVTLVEVKSTDGENGLQFFGSPTIQINGHDIDPSVRERSDFVFG